MKTNCFFAILVLTITLFCPASIYSQTTEILYHNEEGLVLYRYGGDLELSSQQLMDDGACLQYQSNTPFFSGKRCLNFTVPDDAEPGYMNPGSDESIINQNTQIPCTIVQYSYSLFNSAEELVPEPYMVYPGETYNFCVSLSVDPTIYNPTECMIEYTCLAPVLLEMEYQVEHHLNKSNQLFFLNKLPLNTVQDYFAVTADGSQASLFKIKSPLADAVSEEQLGNLSLRIIEDPNGQNPDQYGFFDAPEHNGDSIAIVYHHPKILPSGTAKEYIEYEVEFIDEDFDDFAINTFKLRVYRAPVLLVHGLNSSASAFDDLKNSLTSSSFYTARTIYIVQPKCKN